GFDTRATAEALRVGVHAFIRELWELDKPTVAAVNGVAVGPGAHLALACDFVLVHPATRFLWSFHRWGLVVDAGGAYLPPPLPAATAVAAGPGPLLARACVFVLVLPATRFLWSFHRWGLVVDAGGAYLLPRLVGLPRAKAMVMLGEGCTGAEAVDLGLAYRCL